MMLGALFLGCATAPSPPLPIPVRAGWVGEAPGRPVGGGRFLSSEGGERPSVVSCVPIGAVGLGDLRRWIAAGITAPDTSLAFSPDGRWLAIGSYLGEVVVLDGWTGEVRARKTLAESAVKQVAWSPDGSVLYAAEQSVDGMIRALRAHDLAEKHQYRLADALESSAPASPDDLYGLYTLPAAYALEVLPDGDLLVVGAHGWTTAAGRQNRSQVLRLSPKLTVKARWPAQPADATFLAGVLSKHTLGVSVSRSSGGPGPKNLGVGGVALLDHALNLKSTSVPAPLLPWFDKAFVWEGIGLHGDRLTLGLGDGRVWRDGGGRDLGTPILAGEVPIAATIGSLVDTGDAIYTLTSGTSIPYGSGRSETHAPEAHPAENTVFALDPDTLQTRWSWHGEERLAGLTQRDQWVVVGVGGKEAERHGVLVFDTSRTGTGADRLVTSCHTGQPVFFRTAISSDGRIAVASFPEKRGERVEGDYRVQIFL